LNCRDYRFGRDAAERIEHTPGKRGAKPVWSKKLKRQKKVHSTLIEAFSQVARRVPGAELRVVGGGPLEEKLRTQAQTLGLNGRLRIEGSIRRVADVLRELDIFLMSSTTEGLPLVILRGDGGWTAHRFNTNFFHCFHCHPVRIGFPLRRSISPS